MILVSQGICLCGYSKMNAPPNGGALLFLAPHPEVARRRFNSVPPQARVNQTLQYYFKASVAWCYLRSVSFFVATNPPEPSALVAWMRQK